MKNFRTGGAGRNDRGSSRGGPGGGRFGGKPSFGRPGGGRGRAGGPPELFDAICSRCGKPTLVPFRPNGKKPIFCRDCFSRENHEQEKMGGPKDFPPRRDERPHEKFDRPHDRPFDKHRGNRDDRPPRPEHHREFSPTPRPSADVQISAMQKEIREMSAKLDQILSFSRTSEIRASLAEIPAAKEKPKATKSSKPKKATKKEKGE